MSNISRNATQYLQKRFPHASVTSQEFNLSDGHTGKLIKRLHLIIAHDWQSNIKQRLIAVPNLGADKEIANLAKQIPPFFEQMDSEVFIAQVPINPQESNGHPMNTKMLVNTPKLIIYTDRLCQPPLNIMTSFENNGILIDIVDETNIYNSLFISYGDPDKDYVTLINNHLKSKGIQTWFFPVDALPGEKLHRVMYEGVNNHDRVLLVCSKDSLGRPGLLNEIERVLEREAKQGGVDILIPITLDDYVFKEWSPYRKDIADQIRSRVITKFPKVTTQTQEFNQAANKLIKVLHRKPKQ